MSEQKISKVPQLRFSGFEGEWDEQLLGERYAKIRNAFVGTATPYYTTEGYFYLQSNNIKNGKINRNTEVFVKEDFYLRQKDNWLQTNDIVMVQSGHVGHTAVIPDELNNSAAHALIIISKPTQDTCPHYVNFCLQGNRARRELANITTGNTIRHILASDIKKFDVFFPRHGEQIRLGEYFNALDRLIDLHQRKHGKLVALKKAMIQKMFPQPGSAAPEIRFKGFSEEWEMKQLDEISQRVIRKNNDLESLRPLTISAKYGLIDQTDYFNQRVASKDVSSYFLVRNGEFAYNKSYSEGFPFGAVRRLDRYESGVLSTLYILFSPDSSKVCSDFLVSFFTTDLWHVQVAILSAEGARNHGLLNISATDFFKIKLRLPCSLEEQQKIGTYFLKLDELISRHATQLQKFQQIKSACLEKMFV